MPRSLVLRASRVLAVLLAASPFCVACRGCDEAEEEEERALSRDHYWRVEVVIQGQGAVKTVKAGFDCRSATSPPGDCGPKLLTYKELEPPLMRAVPDEGWRFEHWVSRIREADGASAPRGGPMPDGQFYINGFGYKDTGQLETVTAVFVRDGDGGDGGGSEAPR